MQAPKALGANTPADAAVTILDYAKGQRVLTFSAKHAAGEVSGWWKRKKYSPVLADKIHGRDRVYHDMTRMLGACLGDEIITSLNDIGHCAETAVVIITDLFDADDAKLAYIVHEAMCDLCGLIDAKYPYELHKTLYIKPEGLAAKEWGNGVGAISPHCDDAYEAGDTDLLALTTCRDAIGIPTQFIPVGNILSCLSREEITALLATEATFFSGKNVDDSKSAVRPILACQDDGSIRFFFDCRNEKGNQGAAVDARMVARSNTELVLRIAATMGECARLSVPTKTGTFCVVNNMRGLHIRDAVPLSSEARTQIVDAGDDLSLAPRLLFRSKGARKL